MEGLYTCEDGGYWVRLDQLEGKGANLFGNQTCPRAFRWSQNRKG